MNTTNVIIPEAFPSGADPDHLINLALKKFNATDLAQLGVKIGIAIEDLVFGFHFPDGVRSIRGSRLERFDADAYVGYVRLDKADPYKAATDADTLVSLATHLKDKMPFAKIAFDRNHGFISMVINYCHLEKLFADANDTKTQRLALETAETSGRAHGAMGAAEE